MYRPIREVSRMSAGGVHNTLRLMLPTVTVVQPASVPAFSVAARRPSRCSGRITTSPNRARPRASAAAPMAPDADRPRGPPPGDLRRRDGHLFVAGGVPALGG